mmetsp:Transcript_75448/g.191491  ORF Transcript_75448/g.191491 Transcript_75448/m.191491 type:complete len:419 (-) Transcript_75448:323-1579(-)
MNMKLVFALFGCCLLLPFQCMLSSFVYLDSDAFPKCGYAVLLSPFYNAVSVTTQTLMLFLGEYAAAWKFAMFSLPLAALLCAVPILGVDDGWGDTELRFKVTFGAILGIAFVNTGVFQSSTAALASRLSGDTYGPLQEWWSIGVVFAGVFSAVVASAVQLAAGGQAALIVQFGFCVLLMSASFVCMTILVRQGVFSDEPMPPMEPSPPCSHARYPEEWDTQGPMTPSPGGSSSPLLKRPSSVVFTVADGLLRAWPFLLSMFLVYVQGSLVFPLVIQKWTPPSYLAPELFGIVTVLTVQVFDLVGRLICLSRKFQRAVRVGNHNIWYLLALGMFMPVGCFLSWRMEEHAFLGSLYTRLVLLASLGLSQGLLTNLIFSWASVEAAIGSRSIVARALPLSLCIGIVVGSAVSSTVVSMLEH